MRSLIRSLKSAHSAASRRRGGSASPATTEKGTVIATTGTATSWPLPSMARASVLCANDACTPQAARAPRVPARGDDGDDAGLLGGASPSSAEVRLSKRVCWRRTRKSLPGQRSPARWSGGTYDDAHGRVTSVTTVWTIICARVGASSRVTQRHRLAHAL